MDPLTAAAIAKGGASFLQSLFGFLGGRSRANAQHAADVRADTQRRSLWDANERNRNIRVRAAGRLGGSVQGSLAPGAPNYTFTPEEIAGMSAVRPYAGSLPADPRAGLTQAFLSELFGQGGNVANDYILGRMEDEARREGAVNSTGTEFNSSINYDMCKRYPTLPGCKTGQALFGNSDATGGL